MTTQRALWQTYRSLDGMTAKQTALVDAIDALQCMEEPVGALSTQAAADAVGCDVESAWYSLRSLDWLTCRTPPEAGPVVDEDLLPLETRARSHWELPEDPYTDDEHWYRFRIEAAERIGRADAVEFWKREASS